MPPVEDMVKGIVKAQSELFKEMARTQTKELSAIISVALKESQQLSSKTIAEAIEKVQRENRKFFEVHSKDFSLSSVKQTDQEKESNNSLHRIPSSFDEKEDFQIPEVNPTVDNDELTELFSDEIPLSDEENQIKKETIEKENIQNVKTTSLTNLIDTLNNTYANGYMESMDKFTYTFDINDVDFTEIRNYYTTFKTDYETFKTNVSKYNDLQQELKDIISATDEFLNEFDKATTQTNDVDTVINYWESSAEKWQQSYRLVYKALYGKGLD